MKRLIRKSHFDNIYAIRFLAFLAIFSSNGFITSNQQLNVSTLFTDLRQVTGNLNGAAYSLLFILTGFLSTWSIFEERFIYKKVNVLRYYMRRLLTLFPLYIVVFIVGYFILPRMHTGLESSIGSGIPAWSYLTFSSNFYFNGNSNTTGLTLLISQVTSNMWSIAVTFQFIFIWPILMNYFRRNEIWLFILCLIVFVASSWFLSGNESYRFNTLNILCDFVVGAYLAYFSFFKYSLYVNLKKNTRRTIAAVYLLFFLYIIFRSQILAKIADIPPQIVFIAERIILACTLAYFVFEQNFSSNSILKLAKLKIFNFPGKLAYGLYVYHALGILAGYQLMRFLVDKETSLSVVVLEPFLAISVTIAAALISNEFFEKKFLRRKKNYQPNREYNPVGIQDVKTKPA